MMEQDRSAFLKLATEATECNDPAVLRRACKRLVVLCWMHLTPGDRWSFWDRLLPNKLEFEPPAADEPVRDSDLAYILRRWPEIIHRIADAKARKFAEDINRRRKFKNFVPTERQVAWVKQLWKDYGTEEPEFHVLEEEED